MYYFTLQNSDGSVNADEKNYKFVTYYKREIMKKFSVIAAVVFLMALGFSSCKGQQDCPAYSKVKTEQPTVRV